MKKPTDNTPRPGRPARRFSVMRPPVARSGAAKGGPDAVPADPPGPIARAVRPEPAPAPSAPPATGRAGDEARVAKVMSRAGLCSRREAEGWIKAGRVAVNGAVIDGPALNIGPDDQVTVDGYPIDKPEHTRLFMFHKTRGLVTTARDPEGRPTIYDALPEDLPRLMTIGRLDINTEGLLLLTNDGGLARLLELPATGWLRRYRVRANGRVEQAELDALAGGVTVDGVDYAGIDAKLDRLQGANLWLTLGLREGKNREVKRVLEHLGLSVTRLIRISFGPFQLGDLAENAVEEVRTRVLRDQLGTALARQAGLDFRTEEAEVRPAAAPSEEPRRKTSRSATADRRGRAVAVERIARASRAGSERDAADRPAAARARGRGPSGSSDGRLPDRAERPDGRPARTLRQADADAARREQEPRAARAGRTDRPAADQAARGAGPGRGETARFKGKTRDTERPRTGRNKDEPRRGPGRPAGAGRGEDRPRFERRDGTAAEKGARPGRSGGRDGSGPGRPGGRPPSRNGGPRPDRPGKPTGGGGRGRPRG